jgi:hypothetical protein
VVTTLQLLSKLAGKPEDEVKPEVVLTAEELKVVEQCNLIVRNPAYTREQKLKEAIPLLRPYIGKPLEIFKLCIMSPAIKAICHEDSALTAGWGEALLTRNVPGGEPIKVKSVSGKEKVFEHGGKTPSVDGNKGCYVVDSFIAGGLFTEYQKSEDPLFLDYACEQGFYVALRERCDRTRERIKACVNSVEERNLNPDYESLTNDLTRLGNLYWTVGYLDAARIWRDMGSCYANAIEKDPDNFYWAETFCKAAAENIYCAEILSANEVSQHISKDLYAKKGGLQTVYEFKDWDAGVDNALKLLKLPQAELIDLKVKLKNSAEKRIGELQHKSEAKLRS